MESISLQQKEIAKDLLEQIRGAIDNLLEWNKEYSEADDLLKSQGGMKTLAAKVFMPPGDFRKSSASLYSLFHSSKLSMAPLICSSKSLAISFCCKDIDSISFYLFSKKRTKIMMVTDKVNIAFQ